MFIYSLYIYIVSLNNVKNFDHHHVKKCIMKWNVTMQHMIMLKTSEHIWLCMFLIDCNSDYIYMSHTNTNVHTHTHISIHWYYYIYTGHRLRILQSLLDVKGHMHWWGYLTIIVLIRLSPTPCIQLKIALKNCSISSLVILTCIWYVCNINCRCICVYVCVCVHIQLYMHACLRACVRACMYVCM